MAGIHLHENHRICPRNKGLGLPAPVSDTNPSDLEMWRQPTTSIYFFKSVWTRAQICSVKLDFSLTPVSQVSLLELMTISHYWNQNDVSGTNFVRQALDSPGAGARKGILVANLTEVAETRSFNPGLLLNEQFEWTSLSLKLTFAFVYPPSKTFNDILVYLMEIT